MPKTPPRKHGQKPLEQWSGNFKHQILFRYYSKKAFCARAFLYAETFLGGANRLASRRFDVYVMDGAWS